MGAVGNLMEILCHFFVIFKQSFITLPFNESDMESYGAFNLQS